MPIEYAMVADHVALVTIDRPEKRNALDLDHMRALADCWRRIGDDPDVRVGLVTGVGDAFCVGADLAAMFPPGRDDAATALGAQGAFDAGRPDPALTEWLLKDLAVYKPVVAAVNGHCLAGGMEMLAGSDIRVASENAVFGLPEPKRGIMAAGGSTVRLPRQLSWTAAMEILLVGDAIPAQRALELGIVNEVVPGAHLLERAMDWACRIAANSPTAVQATKESALRNLGAADLATAYEAETAIGLRVLAFGDVYEGSRAFVERRAPRWKRPGSALGSEQTQEGSAG